MKQDTLLTTVYTSCIGEERKEGGLAAHMQPAHVSNTRSTIRVPTEAAVAAAGTDSCPAQEGRKCPSSPAFAPAPASWCGATAGEIGRSAIFVGAIGVSPWVSTRAEMMIFAHARSGLDQSSVAASAPPMAAPRRSAFIPLCSPYAKTRNVSDRNCACSRASQGI